MDYIFIYSSILLSTQSFLFTLLVSITPSIFTPENMAGAGSGAGRQRIATAATLSYLIPKLFIFLIAIGSSVATYMFVMNVISNFHTQIEIDPVVSMPENLRHSEAARRPFHVAMTASAGEYNKWQCRIAYYWYKKVRDLPRSEMGGFTRILHSGKSDNLMDEIPTFVVDPLPSGQDQGYIVLNRPWAFVQWLQKAEIEEEYVLMAEPDHVFVRAMPNLAHGSFPAAYKFFYITPEKNEKIIRKYYPVGLGPVTDVDPIGNSPVIIKKSMLKEIAPTWMNVSMKMKNDRETDRVFGWVLEMYGYAVASALHGVRHMLRPDFMVQPPFDQILGENFIIHYTYGNDYNAKGELTYGVVGDWRFDKRSYIQSSVPRNLTLPPSGVPETVVTLVQKVNEATANIPNWDSFDGN